MKVEAIVAIESDIEITGITLMPIEEYAVYTENIPIISEWWWLRSPGWYPDYAAYVDYDGSIDCAGDSVTIEYNAVRPVLLGSFKDYKDIVEFEFADHSWIVLSKNMAICKDYINRRRFDGKTNNYASSEVKEFLEKWLREALENHAWCKSMPASDLQKGEEK